MSLARLLTHRVTIQRQAAAAGVTKTYQAVLTDVHCLIQPVDPDPVEQPASSFSKDFRVWFPYGTAVKEGDRLVDQDSRTYGVRGVRSRNYGPASLRHLEALVALDRSAA